jgi:hypothetical protein
LFHQQLLRHDFSTRLSYHLQLQVATDPVRGHHQGHAKIAQVYLREHSQTTACSEEFGAQHFWAN